ncbi:hypothetical protein D3C72_1883010 [compost metagenome]
MRQQRALRDRVHARRHVVIDAHNQLADRCWAQFAQRAGNLGFTLQSVPDQDADGVLRACDQEAVPRCQPVEVFLLQRGQRIEVGAHVAVGRADDDGRALHHVVAGEERLLFFEQVAQVVRRVAGRVAHAQGAVVGERDALAVSEFALRREGRVLPLARGRGAAHHGGVGGSLQRGGGR